MYTLAKDKPEIWPYFPEEINVYSLYDMDIENLYGLDSSTEKLYNKNKIYITKNLDFRNFIYINYRAWFL